ncbi:hypothetical protein EH183_21750 [Streptomyces sp. CB01881]|nr:hypothetical protein EH183_21750 [Streptomyces sp. CB01881]
MRWHLSGRPDRRERRVGRGGRGVGRARGGGAGRLPVRGRADGRAGGRVCGPAAARSGHCRMFE